MKQYIGKKIKYWCSGREDGISTILDIRPYTGRYPECADYIIKITAMNTYRGWMETSISKSDLDLYIKQCEQSK